jgi:hypothetical protein
VAAAAMGGTDEELQSAFTKWCRTVIKGLVPTVVAGLPRVAESVVLLDEVQEALLEVSCYADDVAKLRRSVDRVVHRLGHW